MKIGQLVSKVGVTTKAVRFYELQGLLPAPSRTPSGYRIYGRSDTERLSFNLKAKRLGLSLDDIKGILQLHDRNEPSCIHVRSLLDAKIAQLDSAVADLQAFRRELTSLRDGSGTLVDCKPAGGQICSIIEDSEMPGLQVSGDWPPSLKRRQ